MLCPAVTGVGTAGHITIEKHWNCENNTDVKERCRLTRRLATANQISRVSHKRFYPVRGRPRKHSPLIYLNRHTKFVPWYNEYCHKYEPHTKGVYSQWAKQYFNLLNSCESVFNTLSLSSCDLPLKPLMCLANRRWTLNRAFITQICRILDKRTIFQQCLHIYNKRPKRLKHLAIRAACCCDDATILDMWLWKRTLLSTCYPKISYFGDISK